MLLMIFVNVIFQIFLTYTPGIQDVWDTKGLGGLDWLRVIAFGVAMYIILELQKVGLQKYKRKNNFVTETLHTVMV